MCGSNQKIDLGEVLPPGTPDENKGNDPDPGGVCEVMHLHRENPNPKQ
jgi:hypothetical protein